MAKAEPSPGTRRVYSYIRFSTSEQAKGNSLQRQQKLAADWCERNGCVLDKSLTLHDLGVSAFKGLNATQGRLNAFLQAIDNSKVERGAILLVESLDRLSRSEIGKALELFLGILNRGITIVTLNPEDMFDQDSTNDLVKIIIALVIMSRAYEESATKSKRIRESRDAARVKARSEGKLLTSLGPAWLTHTNGEFQVIPEAVKAIRMLFKLSLEGMGKTLIAKTLNQKAPWTPPATRKGKRGGNGWRESYIQKILNNRAVLGEYQPYKGHGSRNRIPEGEPIQGYYPAIIHPDVFHAVQSKRTETRGRGGQTGKVNNLFKGMTYCAYCGGKMPFEAKDSTKQWWYLVCDNGRRGVECKAHRVRYVECEHALLENCSKLKPEQILPSQDEQAALCQNLKMRIQGEGHELAEIERKLDNLVQRVGDAPTKEIADRVYKQMAEHEERKRTLAAEKEADERALRTAEQGQQSFTAWKSNLETLRAELAKRNDLELRLRLREHLAELIEKIEVFAVGYPEEYNPNGNVSKTRDRQAEDLADYIDAVAPLEIRRNKLYSQFLDDITKRRMSKEGRFLRVHYKSGATFDLVPGESLATGMRLIKGEWTHKTPDVGRLWEEFIAKRGQSK